MNSKGVTNTMIKINVNKTCAYQEDGGGVGGDSPQIGRKCIGNLQNGPRWQTVHTEVCSAKYATTNDLLHLTKVSFVCVMCEFFKV